MDMGIVILRGVFFSKQQALLDVLLSVDFGVRGRGSQPQLGPLPKPLHP